MPLDFSYPKAIVFIVGEYEKDGVTHEGIVGTGWIVGLRFSDETVKRRFLYVVTAAHVVRPLIQSWVQINKKDGTVARLRVPQWYEHPSNDYADDVATIYAPLDPSIYDFAVIPYENFVKENLRPNIGARVYFIGLLGYISEMAEKNIPMVRSGSIGAVSQSGIPIKIAPGTTIKVTGHLIDCRSFQGFSGSPCFIQTDSIGIFGKGPDATVEWSGETVLIGMLIAHFDVDRPAALTGDFASMTGNVAVPLNTGVGVVLPAQKIRETLNQEILMRDRQAKEEKYKDLKNKEDEIAATADSGEFGEPILTKETFEDVLKKASRRVSESSSKDADKTE
jgi:hypothetical protein